MPQKTERFERLALETKIADPVKRAALEKLNFPELHKKLQWLKSVLPSELNGDGKMLIEGEDLDEITKQAITFASDVVFCHNDLLSGNILHSDAWDRVQIIDYEYGTVVRSSNANHSHTMCNGVTHYPCWAFLLRLLFSRWLQLSWL